MSPCHCPGKRLDEEPAPRLDTVSGDHYFSDNPVTPATAKDFEFSLPDRALSVQGLSGTFSHSGLDKGTGVLLEHTPPPPPGVLVDLGCGWGPIAMTLAHYQPEATVFAVDINPRALEATRENAERAGFPHITPISPDEFPEGTAIDCLWSNPPIRIGKEALHQLLTTWLNRLSPDGSAWLVVSKNLGADSLQTWINGGGAGAFQCERMASKKSFRVLQVRKKS